nr:MAG TPA: Di-sulfide bridge nucleocytoplasmic transport domain [Caudoviricetes sp.]
MLIKRITLKATIFLMATAFFWVVAFNLKEK